ncbi:MAG: hypothetical protein ACREMI_09150 [Gemmatimonadales bacterium]
MSESSPAGMRPVAQPELAIVPHAGRAPDVRPTRIMPLADSILWSPSIGGPHRPAPLMFFAQHTLRKIHDRLASVPNGLGMGLLAGRSYTDSRSGAQFVVIDGALPLPALAAEDEAIEALAEGMRSAAAGIEIFGWYRGHSFSDAALTPSDVEAQSELFGDRPCVVVVVSAGGEAGAVFRNTSSPAWPVEALPFYELLAEPASPDGLKPSMLTWRNYRASEPVAQPAPPAAATASERANNLVLFPDAGIDDEQAPPPPSQRVAWYRPFLRPALYVASALGGALLVVAVSALISSSNGSSTGSRANGAGANAADPAMQAAAAVLLDGRADTLALALAAFGDRMRMFDARQMPCPGLARGLQQVEDGWLAYNIARKETLAPFDSQREVRDQSLYADVRSVERRFERSGCPRP